MRGSINFHFNENTAAFEQDPKEAERLLDEVLGKAKSIILEDEVPLDGQSLPLTDVNGNKVGEVHIHPQ